MIFYVDSEYEVRNSIFDLHHVLWPDLWWITLNKTNDMGILVQQIQIFPHPDLTWCGLQLSGSCNCFWDIWSSIWCFIIQWVSAILKIYRIGMGGECRINLSNQVNICDNKVRNATGNSLGKRNCWYLCSGYSNYGQYYQKWNQWNLIQMSRIIHHQDPFCM